MMAPAVLTHQSGRVIALGRAMLATLFLVAIWLDETQPTQAPAASYVFLAAYVVWAAGLAAVSWSSWWHEARLAGPAHVVDIAVFTGVVFSTNGYTSPFFLFFVFLLLTSAIRWGWRETALTALILVGLYLSAGLFVASSGAEFEVRRFVIRSGHLLILSVLLIWFGINQRLVRLAPAFEDGDHAPVPKSSAEEHALTQVMRAIGAGSGLLLMQKDGGGVCSGPSKIHNECQTVAVKRPPIKDRSFANELLFDLRRDRALAITARRRLRFGQSRTVLDQEIARQLGMVEGMACAFRTGTAKGWLILGDIDAMAVDHLELGRELALVAAGLLERHELLHAIADSAAADTRLSLARDLHDSIVQFLAGAAFRLEAIRRATPQGVAFDQICELKRLVLDEQNEIRGVVLALRRGPDLTLPEVATELESLVGRLGQQWSVRCSFHCEGSAVAIPIQLHLDLQHLLREALANSVRHGGADRVDISVTHDAEQLQLQIVDNGGGLVAVTGDAMLEPWSLKERVERARGSLMLVSHSGRTTVSIALPLAGAQT